MNNSIHLPVLLEEVLRVLDPHPGQIFIDATVNGGGHARAIAERVGEKGKVIGIDWDCELLCELGIKNKELGIRNMPLECRNYTEIGAIAKKFRVAEKVDGVLFDLGFSSHHVESSGRGFSFLKDEPLDMRYSAHENELTAAKICNTWSYDAIANILRRFGEERYAKRITGAILLRRRMRPFRTTGDLTSVIDRAVPRGPRRGRIHPATRTFQALRIAVNRELENVREGIARAFEVVKKGGRVAVISFHSLEDWIVKEQFRSYEKENRALLLMKKPMSASYEEVKLNPRARSAKLRAIAKQK